MHKTMRRFSGGASALATLFLSLALAIGASPASARGGFGGGGFGGGGDFRGGGDDFRGGDFGGGDRGDFDHDPSSFGDGGGGDRGVDAGFGRDGYGSFHAAPGAADRAAAYGANRPYDAAHPDQQQHNQAAQQSLNAERTDWNHASEDWEQHNQNWNTYYSGVAYDHDVAVGTAFATVPAGAYALNYLGANYWYASGAWYQMQENAYVVVPPVVGAVIPEAPPTCSPIESPDGQALICGGVYYAQVPEGYKVIAPPIGATVASMPSGAARKTVNGVSYYTYGGAWYRPVYHSGSVSYKIVKAPA